MTARLTDSQLRELRANLHSLDLISDRECRNAADWLLEELLEARELLREAYSTMAWVAPLNPFLQKLDEALRGAE